MKRSENKRLRLLLASTLLCTALTACVDEPDPASYLQGLRVLALTWDPQEAVRDDAVTVSAHLYVPPGETVTAQSFTFCPVSGGAVTAYACFDERCVETFELTPDATASVELRPLELAAACFTRLAGEDGAGGAPGDLGDIEDLPSYIETIVTYRVETSDGDSRETVARVPFYPLEDPEFPNTTPVVSGVVVSSVTADDVTLQSGATIAPVGEGDELTFRITVDPTSLDTYQDGLDREQTEEAITSCFASAGRFENGRVAGTEAEVVWKAKELEEGEESAQFWFVTRDLRGGQVVSGPFGVEITPVVE